MSVVVTSKGLEAFGGDRFRLIIAATHRARQIQRGSPVRVENKANHKPSVLAIMEIEEGLYTQEEYLRDITPKSEKEQANEHFSS